MNKRNYRIASVIMALALTLGTFSSVQASPQSADFYKHLAPGDSAAWTFQTSGSVESITATSDGWVCKAGGNVAGTHYARIRYMLPEKAGKVLTTFYMKAVIVLPPDFYTQKKSGFRLLGTDNFGTTLNGVKVGAASSGELRTAVYFYSDHYLRIVAEHEDVGKKVFYKSSALLPVGEHTFEFYGSLSEVAPWYFKLDGAVVASGVERLSPDSVPVKERVATRLYVGIDGAPDQDQNPMSVLVKSFEVAEYDRSGANPKPPTPTPIQPTQTPVQPTSTPVEPTQTLVQPTSTLVEPATTLVPPTATFIPTAIAIVQPTTTSVSVGSPSSETIYDSKIGDFVYSSGWTTVSKEQAYGGSYKLTKKNGASVTFPFTGTSFSIVYKAGKVFGKMKVYVDGVLVGTINQKGASVHQLRWDYSNKLAPGNHTLKLIFVRVSEDLNNGSLDAVIVR